MGGQPSSRCQHCHHRPAQTHISAAARTQLSLESAILDKGTLAPCCHNSSSARVKDALQAHKNVKALIQIPDSQLPSQHPTNHRCSTIGVLLKKIESTKVISGARNASHYPAHLTQIVKSYDFLNYQPSSGTNGQLAKHCSGQTFE